jgi:hypothetical protein
MSTPFSLRVAEPSWLADVAAWVRRHAETAGVHVVGPVEQTRIRPWSTQVVVPTDVGRWWFKACCRAAGFEPGIHAVLADLAPGGVAAPLAVDADRGWLLTADQGATLHDRGEPTVGDWARLVAENARLQATVAGHRDALVGAGLPDCSPGTVVDRFDRLVSMYSELPDRHPAHVAPELAARLRSARPRVVDAADCLAASRLPNTWQHGDLHPGNAFVAGTTDEMVRLFDFGDSQWAHALEALVVPHGWITSSSQIPWPPVLAACAQAWGVDPDELADQWWAASTTHAVNRSLTWWGCLAEATAAEWEQWGQGPINHLSRVLDA